MNSRMIKFWVFAFSMAAFVLGAEATPVVHSPVEAVLSGENPKTDTRGATWTFSKRVHANPPLSQGSLLSYYQDGTDYSGLIGFEQAWGDGAEVPYILVNTTEEARSVVNCGTVQPGEILFHPTGTCYGQTETRAVMTFAVPRNGYYSMRARFRANIGVEGGVETSVFLNGGILLQEEIKRVGAVTNGTPVELDGVFLKKGDELAFVVGPDEPGEWGHGCDATVLMLELVELESFGDDVVLGAADLGKAMLVQTDAGIHGSDTFADPSGLGSWTFRSTVYTGDATMDGAWWNVPISCYSDNTIMGPGGVVFKYMGQDTTPAVTVCGFDGTAGSSTWYGGSWPESVWRNERGCYLPFDTVSPGEVCVYPGGPYGEYCSTFMRFAVSRTGTYIVTLNARDLCKSIDAVGDGDGVDVALFISGVKKFEQRVSFEVEPHVAFLQLPAQMLRDGETVDVRVYSRQKADGSFDNGYDGTALFVDIARVEVSTGRYEADVAMCEGVGRALSENPGSPGSAQPFMSQGAAWSVGLTSNPGQPDGFQPIHGWVNSRDASWNNDSVGLFEGWVGDDGLPAVMANLTSAQSSYDGTDVQPNEFLMCPHSWGVYGVLRFVAPKDGVYSVAARCRDIDPWMNGWISLDNYGVICHLVANGRYAATDHACNDVRVAQAYGWMAPYLQDAVLNVDRVYLKAGEFLDLCVGARGGREEDRDSTGVSETIMEAETKDVASVNIMADGNGWYSGRGRVGFGERWGQLSLRSGSTAEQYSSNLRNNAGRRTVVCLSVAPANGQGTTVQDGSGGLLSSGLKANDASDVYVWTVSGLPPHSAYRLYLYGTGDASFACGETTAGLTGQWSTPKVAEYAVLDAIADANGKIVGSFSGGDGAAAFCALQVEGDAFAEPVGFTVFLR